MDLVANVAPYFLVLLIAGVACGFINTLASSGSAISLPMLITLGLPALNANATNRLPVLFGSLMALRTFHAAGKIDWPAARKIVLPATIGSAAGGYLAARLSNRQLGLLIIAALFVRLAAALHQTERGVDQGSWADPTYHRSWATCIVSVGIWLGFIVLDGATNLLFPTLKAF